MDENTRQEEPKKKISLQEAMKQQLANKKNSAANFAKGKGGADTSTKKMQSQMTKKPSNTRRKMGV
ncbi:hypothetical protein D1B31_08130 [Neobacillus notoginsengisoli]|uniref:Uncharacterized protein n=1 Tax=Neobacillus notoginsengisoli TaxID=1578198 RepID=A0A417YWP7_9BACI|nr:hypothetical protein [Neobacillus notoginsengisoli]RHW41671.1 hypothetical protein D1B31_08130 [Neobacillus notoginsengisoli]